MKKLIIYIGILILTCNIAGAQTGELKGKIVDGETGAPLAFGYLTLIQNNALKDSAMADSNGHYIFINVAPGTYKMIGRYIAYAPDTIKEVSIKAGFITYQDIKLMPSPFFYYKKHHKKNKKRAPCPTCATGPTPIKILKAAGTKNKTQLTATYYLDGIPMTGGAIFSAAIIKDVTVVTEGVPARYENTSDGIIIMPPINFISTCGMAKYYCQ